MVFHARRGFTLIELSVVLVIIGLIIGGVLVGRDMIKQAELRKLISDVEHYKTAVNTFRLKYECLPGDCANATNFFGISSTGCWTPPSGGSILAAGSTGTCNGDGDGIIYNQPVRGNGYSQFEPLLVWNHLSLAGLVPGIYTGVGVGANGYFGLQAGTNVPYTIRNMGIDMMTYCLGLTSSCTEANAFVAGNLFNTGSAPGDYRYGGALTTLEAQSLDTKFDDGLPNTGNITGGLWYGWGDPMDCMLNGNASTFAGGNAYDMTKAGAICGLFFQFSLN